MNYSEQTLRNGFCRGFDFFEFNKRLVKQYCSKEIILGFDPTHISKIGKDGRVKKGLELGCLAAIDVRNKTGFHLAAVQTPCSKERKKNKRSLIAYYRDFILSQILQT